MTQALQTRADVGKLVDAFLSCTSRAELFAFMRDVMTEKEILEFANRLTAAQLLANGETYEDVSRKTGMSSTTVARVNKWRTSGMSGYVRVLQNIANSAHHTPSRIVRR